MSNAGQVLVDAYNSVPGSSGPYANPESLVFVIDCLAMALIASAPKSKAEKLCAAKLKALSENFFKD